jgi:hypothetical protein
LSYGLSPFYSSYFSGRVLCFCLRLASDHDPRSPT